MKIITNRKVVTIDKMPINYPNYYLNENGETYIPFDAKTELEEFQDEYGETFYYSADGEHFYNAKGQKLLGAFKKIGKGIVKTGKFIGKIAKKVGRAVVKASKKVSKGVKKIGGKVKTGSKKLIHHKKKDNSEKSKTDTKGKNIVGGVLSGANAKNQNNAPKNEGGDVFTKQLPLANENTSPENLVDVNGKKYDAANIPKNKEVVSTVDENGNPIAGVEFEPHEVVAITGSDGNIEYHTPDAVGMSKTLKIGLIVGGSVILLGLIGLLIYKSKNNKGK